MVSHPFAGYSEAPSLVLPECRAEIYETTLKSFTVPTSYIKCGSVGSYTFYLGDDYPAEPNVSSRPPHTADSHPRVPLTLHTRLTPLSHVLCCVRQIPSASRWSSCAEWAAGDVADKVVDGFKELLQLSRHHHFSFNEVAAWALQRAQDGDFLGDDEKEEKTLPHPPPSPPPTAHPGRLRLPAPQRGGRLP